MKMKSHDGNKVKLVVLVVLAVLLAGIAVVYAVKPDMLLGYMGGKGTQSASNLNKFIDGPGKGGSGGYQECLYTKLPDLNLENGTGLRLVKLNPLSTGYDDVLLMPMIENAGKALPAGTKFEMSYESGNQELIFRPVKVSVTLDKELPCGGTYVVNVPYQLKKTVANLGIGFTVDSSNVIGEQNENNNKMGMAELNRGHFNLSNGLGGLSYSSFGYPYYYTTDVRKLNVGKLNYAAKLYTKTLTAAELSAWTNMPGYYSSVAMPASVGTGTWAKLTTPAVKLTSLVGYFPFPSNEGHIVMVEETITGDAVSGYSELIYIPPVQ